MPNIYVKKWLDNCLDRYFKILTWNSNRTKVEPEIYLLDNGNGNSMNQGAGMYKDILVTIRYDTDTIWYTYYKRRPTYVTNMESGFI